MEIESWGKKNPVLIIKGGVCYWQRAPKNTRMGLHLPPFLQSPHSTHALPLRSPWASRSQSKWDVEADGFASRPLLVPSTLRSLMELRSAELPLLSSAAWGQLFLDRADIPYSKKKKKGRKKERKHLKSLQSFSPWQWVFLFHVRESGLGLEGKGSQPSVPSE